MTNSRNTVFYRFLRVIFAVYMPLLAVAMGSSILLSMSIYNSGVTVQNSTQYIPMSIRGEVVFITFTQQVAHIGIFGLILVAFFGWFVLAFHIQSKYNVRLFGDRFRKNKGN